MTKVFNSIKAILIRIYKNEYVRVFALIYVLGLLCFGICAFNNGFTIPMGGDYVLQTYSFYAQGYEIFWDFVKTGNFPLFDFSNFLGANYVGTQSFYYLFSPLFYLLCLWPRAFLYQGIFFHMVFKFALGGFFMYILLKKYFHVSKNLAWLGGFIYAFSGWALYYLWFHFSDLMAVFPLFIMGVEKCLKERKGWLLSLGLFLCGMCNYLLFVNVCIFGILYALYRWIYIYGINKKRGYSASVRWGVLLQGVLYCFVGVLMTGICLLPSLHVVMSSTRTQTSYSYLVKLLSTVFVNPGTIDGHFVFGEAKVFKDIFNGENLKQLFNILFVWEERTISGTEITANSNIGYILSNWIYMNTNCWSNLMFNNAPLDNAIGGFFITTPLTMLLIPSIVSAVKTKRPWTIFGIIICLTLPFFPITSHAAFAFTNLYGRWQLWLVLIGILFIIPTLDKFELVNRRWVTLNLILNYAIAIVVYLISSDANKLPTAYKFNIFGTQIPGFILITIIELIVMFVVWLVYRFKIFNPALVKKIMVIIAVVEIGASTVVTVENKGYFKWDQYYLSQPSFSELTQVVEDIKDNDDSFYRIMNTEATRSAMNMPSTLNYAGASTFNSSYTFALDEFKNRSRMAYSGGWTMGNHEKRYWLDQYIGTKYYIIDKQDINNDNAEYYRDRTKFFDGRTSITEEKQDYRINLSWNYEKIKEYEYYEVYENKAFTGIGYTVDKAISKSSVGTSSYVPSYYEDLYSNVAILDNETLNEIEESVDSIEKINHYSANYQTINFSTTNSTYKWDLYFSPREYVDRNLDVDESGKITYKRHTVKLNESNFTKNEISKYLPSNEQFLHRRWEEKNRFGDQFIYELKDDVKVASLASSNNMAYITLSLKLGPKILVSFYNDDVLVTQDAHMNSNSSLSKDSYEWKNQRGYYVNQPFNKIVLEFVADTTYAQAFQDNGIFRGLEINVAYQDDISSIQNQIKTNMLTDVTYNNNKFTFKTNTGKRKIAVTNIPYDDGWTLKANGSELNIINVNGGFVGFITNIGETNYELSYFTPNLKEGFAVTGIGILLYIALYFVYKNKKVSILLCEEQIFSVYLKKQQEIEDKYFKDLEQKKNSFIEKIKQIFKSRGKK